MSDRKYRQHGYQDDDRPRQQRPQGEKRPLEPRAPGRQLQSADGPKTPNLMGAHEVFKCARCGNRLDASVDALSRCARCGVDVHSCINCVSFDTGSRWECSQASLLQARVAPKDERNTCELFAPRTTVERQTGTPQGPPDQPTARQAFDDLFK